MSAFYPTGHPKMGRAVNTVWVALALLATASCALRSAPSGTWSIVEGDTGHPYLRAGWWLHIDAANARGEVTVYWDNGLTCSSERGSVSGRRVSVPTVFEVTPSGVSGAKLVPVWDPSRALMLKKGVHPFLGCE